MKKILLFLSVVVTSILLLASCSDEKYDIVVTNFVGYDAARAVTKDTDKNIKMLIKPANDIHSYQPSATDIKAVLNCDLFIYIGGESDSEWVEEKILGNEDAKKKALSMFSILEGSLYEEEEDHDEEEHEHEEEIEYDEHVWTDPTNYIKIVNAVSKRLSSIDSDNKDKYEANASAYVKSLTDLDNNMKDAIQSTNKGSIVVADRNPFLYFKKHYGIEVIGALAGCSSDKNVPTSKIVSLKNSVETNQLKAIFIIELSDGNIAEAVKREISNDIKNSSYNGSEVSVELLYSMQNISADDFNNGKTYLDMFSHNVEVIKKIN